MPTARGGAAVGVVDGILYAAGGSNPGISHWLQTVEAYDPAADNWTTVAPLPASVTVGATSPDGATVTFAASASDPDDAAGPVICSHDPGSAFPIGTTNVTCSSTDTHGNTGSASFMVAVLSPAPW